jgi:hypothetical protein
MSAVLPTAGRMIALYVGMRNAHPATVAETVETIYQLSQLTPMLHHEDVIITVNGLSSIVLLSFLLVRFHTTLVVFL